MGSEAPGARCPLGLPRDSKAELPAQMGRSHGPEPWALWTQAGLRAHLYHLERSKRVGSFPSNPPPPGKPRALLGVPPTPRTSFSLMTTPCWRDAESLPLLGEAATSDPGFQDGLQSVSDPLRPYHTHHVSSMNGPLRFRVCGFLFLFFATTILKDPSRRQSCPESVPM